MPGILSVGRLFGATLLVTGMGCTRVSWEYARLGHGATLAIKRSYSPGFVDPSIKWEYFLRWSFSFRRPFGWSEKLPPGFPWVRAKECSLEVRRDSVWLFSDRGFAMRDGGRDAMGSGWSTWLAVPPSDALFNYMDHVARANGDRGVTRKAYTISKRLGEHTVSGTETETLATLVYAAKPLDGPNYFISPTAHTGHWLPHRVRKIDYAKRIIYCISPVEIPGMPWQLVFVPRPDRPGGWQFDRTLTEALNGHHEPAGRQPPDPANHGRTAT